MWIYSNANLDCNSYLLLRCTIFFAWYFLCLQMVIILSIIVFTSSLIVWTFQKFSKKFSSTLWKFSILHASLLNFSPCSLSPASCLPFSSHILSLLSAIFSFYFTYFILQVPNTLTKYVRLNFLSLLVNMAGSCWCLYLRHYFLILKVQPLFAHPEYHALNFADLILLNEYSRSTSSSFNTWAPSKLAGSCVRLHCTESTYFMQYIFLLSM